MVLLEKRKASGPVLLITCANGGYHQTLSHSLFAGCVATTDCRTIVDPSRSRHLGSACQSGTTVRLPDAFVLSDGSRGKPRFFVTVPEVSRGVSFTVLDSELALDSVILSL